MSELAFMAFALRAKVILEKIAKESLDPWARNMATMGLAPLDPDKTRREIETLQQSYELQGALPVPQIHPTDWTQDGKPWKARRR